MRTLSSPIKQHNIHDMNGVHVPTNLLSVFRGTCRKLECSELATLLFILDTIQDNLSQVQEVMHPILQVLREIAITENRRRHSHD